METFIAWPPWWPKCCPPLYTKSARPNWSSKSKFCLTNLLRFPFWSATSLFGQQIFALDHVFGRAKANLWSANIVFGQQPYLLRFLVSKYLLAHGVFGRAKANLWSANWFWSANLCCSVLFLLSRTLSKNAQGFLRFSMIPGINFRAGILYRGGGKQDVADAVGKPMGRHLGKRRRPQQTAARPSRPRPSRPRSNCI